MSFRNLRSTPQRTAFKTCSSHLNRLVLFLLPEVVVAVALGILRSQSVEAVRAQTGTVNQHVSPRQPVLHLYKTHCTKSIQDARKMEK